MEFALGCLRMSSARNHDHNPDRDPDLLDDIDGLEAEMSHVCAVEVIVKAVKAAPERVAESPGTYLRQSTCSAPGASVIWRRGKRKYAWSG